MMIKYEVDLLISDFKKCYLYNPFIKDMVRVAALAFNRKAVINILFQNMYFINFLLRVNFINSHMKITSPHKTHVVVVTYMGI